MDLPNIFGQNQVYILFVVYIWSLLWKGLALWRAAQLKQRNWFVGILILNTIGILEIVYLFFFAKKKMKLEELKFWENK
jgi:methionyl-tRNA synthetase